MGKKFVHRERLLMMDRKMCFEFVLVAHVRIRYLGKIKTFYFDVDAYKDLHTFIYSLLNPFTHDEFWQITGDSYHSTFFYRKKMEEKLPVTSKYLEFLVSHTMKMGLLTHKVHDESANQILAAF